MNNAFLLGALLLSITTFGTGCAAPEDADLEEESGETTSNISGTVTGKCPANHVCAYQNANYNDLTPQSAWSYQFGPEELYKSAIDRKFQRRFTGGKDKVTSLINNSKITVCLINETVGGYRSTVIYRLGPGKRTPNVGAAANDKADRIEEC